MILHLLESHKSFYINGIIFFFGLYSFVQPDDTEINSRGSVYQEFISFYCRVVVHVWISYSVSIHSPMKVHLGCFQVLAIKLI